MAGFGQQFEPFACALARRRDAEQVGERAQKEHIVGAERVWVGASRCEHADRLSGPANRDGDLAVPDERLQRVRCRLAEADIVDREAVGRGGERLGEEVGEPCAREGRAAELGDERLLPLAPAQLLDGIQLFHAHEAQWCPKPPRPALRDLYQAQRKRRPPCGST